GRVGAGDLHGGHRARRGGQTGDRGHDDIRRCARGDGAQSRRRVEELGHSTPVSPSAAGSGSSAASFSSSDSPSPSATWSDAAQSSGGSTTSSPSSLRTSSESRASAGRSVSSTPPLPFGESGNSGSTLSTFVRLPDGPIAKRHGGSRGPLHSITS